ncbi:GNAT family N-acetyltransferase [Rhizobium sp. R339]|uniref:GNAT family N-acetyltransferase n=1 Tax=Rhizobium sp. R339 TaxID=1764273 RepID=UPI000B52B9DB|nr:GNAT family N-acetyltransferase [Rhizobium sp. R339]
MMIDIRVIRDRLPQEIVALESEARCEGHLHITRLIQEWSAGEVRFDDVREKLLAAYAGQALAGIGGMTVEHAMAGALRMRRFYVQPAMRGHGIGRMLAQALLDHGRSFCTLATVHAGNDRAAKFWESLGFQPREHHRYTHSLELR